MSSVSVKTNLQTLIPINGWYSFSSEFRDLKQTPLAELFKRFTKESTHSRSVESKKISGKLIRQINEAAVKMSEMLIESADNAISQSQKSKKPKVDQASKLNTAAADLSKELALVTDKTQPGSQEAADQMSKKLLESADEMSRQLKAAHKQNKIPSVNLRKISEELSQELRGKADELTRKMKSQYATIIWKRNLRDLYMCYSILGNKKALKEVVAIGQILSADPKDLFGDINEMLEDEFDPLWIINSLIYLRSILNIMPSRNKLGKRINEYPDQLGGQLEDILSLRPLRLYRTMYHLRKLVPSVQEFIDPDDKGKTLDLPPQIYYPLLLRFHSRLIENFPKICNLLLQTSEGTNPDLTAKKIQKILVTGSHDNAQVAIETMEHIRETVSEEFFPEIIIPARLGVLEEDSPTVPKLSANSGRSEKKRVYKLISKDTRVNTLPLDVRALIIENILSDTLHKYHNKPSKILKKLSKLVVVAYRRTNTIEEFKEVVRPVCEEVYLQTRNQTFNNEQELTDVWTNVFNGKFSKKQLSMMINQLNIECARLYRSANLYDLCPGLSKFLHGEEESKIQTESKSKSLNDMYENDQSGKTIEKEKRTTSTPELSRDQNFYNFEPNHLTLVELFNKIQSVTLFYLLTAKNDREVVKFAANAINFATLAIDGPVANFHVAFAIYLVFCMEPIQRLDFLKESLPSEAVKNFHRLEELFLPNSNFKNLRNAMENSRYPFIPYLGIYTKDFTFAIEAENTEEQKEIVRELMGKFDELREILKSSIPVIAHNSDSFKFLNSFDLGSSLTKPVKKIDMGENRKWKKHEWDKLSEKDKAWYVSTYRWPFQNLNAI